MENIDLFYNIKQRVIEWINSERRRLEKKGVIFCELSNTEELYRVEMEFCNCLAEIIVCKPDFAPYRYVSIMILSKLSYNIVPIYAWYDDDKTDINMIWSKLDEAIKFSDSFS